MKKLNTAAKALFGIGLTLALIAQAVAGMLGGG